MIKAKIYGPTSRPYGRLEFDTLGKAAAWCRRHPSAWISITRVLPSGKVRVKRSFKK